MDALSNDAKTCGGDCGRCGLSEADAHRADAAGLSGWRMMLATGSSFLLPLALAALGAWLVGPSGVGQVLGAVIGLALGGLLGVLAMRAFVPSEEKS